LLSFRWPHSDSPPFPTLAQKPAGRCRSIRSRPGPRYSNQSQSARRPTESVLWPCFPRQSRATKQSSQGVRSPFRARRT
jgi:hypothetical protein